MELHRHCPGVVGIDMHKICIFGYDLNITEISTLLQGAVVFFVVLNCHIKA